MVNNLSAKRRGKKANEINVISSFRSESKKYVIIKHPDKKFRLRLQNHNQFKNVQQKKINPSSVFSQIILIPVVLFKMYIQGVSRQRYNYCDMLESAVDFFFIKLRNNSSSKMLYHHLLLRRGEGWADCLLLIFK